jgi:hypothetical protein
MVNSNKTHEKFVSQFGSTMTYVGGGGGGGVAFRFTIPTIFTRDQMGYKKLAQQVHKEQGIQKHSFSCSKICQKNAVFILLLVHALRACRECSLCAPRLRQ